MEKYHVPVMLQEVLEYLDPKPGEVIVDATLGTAGHSEAILERIGPSGTLVAVDRDQESLEAARERLKGRPGKVHFVHGNFSEIDQLLKELNISAIDGILFDLGISSFQLENPQRGFSFQAEGPLDMRLDRESYISAYDLVNNLSEGEISNMLWTFGEERWHNRIARRLVEERKEHPIATTSQLSEIVVRAIPPRFRHGRAHAATRTFQAVRIAVNRELEVLEAAVSKAVELLSPGGRICVIAFHSLEDRIVKLNFRAAAQEGRLRILTAKPLVPGRGEIKSNPSSRSSKFRAAVRTGQAQ